MSEDVEISDYILNKGAMGILFELGVEEKSFNQLKESSTVLVSPNTLSRRLTEGEDLGLIDRGINEDGERAIITYRLTDMGETLVDQFEDVSDEYFELKEDIANLKEKRHKKEKELRQLLSEHAGKKLRELSETESDGGEESGKDPGRTGETGEGESAAGEGEEPTGEEVEGEKSVEEAGGGVEEEEAPEEPDETGEEGEEEETGEEGVG
ncbi:MAG: winged helix-turn-helix transcriptional regulator, partial [Candidatus Aenigmatarchaeota archaeon]